jgi:hypothetical protein
MEWNAAGTAGLEHARDELRRQLPSADVWFVKPAYGPETWHLKVKADTPGHLIDELRSVVRDADEAGL